MVVVGIDEARAGGLAEVARRARFQVVKPVVAVFEIERVPAARAVPHRWHDPGGDFGAGAGPEIHLVYVHEVAAEHAAGVVGRFVDRDRARAGARQLHRLPVVGAERHQAVLVHVPGGDDVPVAIARGAQFLLRDDVDIASVPDLDIARVLVALGRCGLFVPVRDPDENDPAVLAPRGRARSHDALARRGFNRLLRAQVLPDDHGVALAFEILVLYRAQRCQVARFLTPGQRTEDRGAAVQDFQFAIRRIVDLYAVAFAPLHPDGHGEMGALVLPGETGDVAERGVGAGTEVAHGERRAHRVGAFDGRAGALRRIAAERKEGAFAGEGEALYIVHGGGRARVQVHDAEPVLHRFLGLFEFVLVGFGHADRVGHPARIAGESGLGAERRHLRRAARHRVHAQLGGAVAAPDGRRQPLAVGREHSRAQGFELAVVRRSDSRFGLGCGQRGRGQNERCDARHGCVSWSYP